MRSRSRSKPRCSLVGLVTDRRTRPSVTGHEPPLAMAFNSSHSVNAGSPAGSELHGCHHGRRGANYSASGARAL